MRFIKIILVFIVIFFDNTIHATILNDSIVVVFADNGADSIGFIWKVRNNK